MTRPIFLGSARPGRSCSTSSPRSVSRSSDTGCGGGSQSTGVAVRRAGGTIRAAIFVPPRGWRRRGDRGSLAVVATNVTSGAVAAVGLAHFAVFWGFLVLFTGTVILTIDFDVVRLSSPRSRARTVVLLREVLRDLLGHPGHLRPRRSAGLGYLIVRRGMQKPFRLDYSRAAEPEGGYSRRQFVLGDWLFAGGLGRYCSPACRGGRADPRRGVPALEKWSPAGWVIGRVYELGISVRLRHADTWFWWVHAVLALAFVAYIPYAKSMHMLADGVNLLAHEEWNTGTARPAPRHHPRRLQRSRTSPGRSCSTSIPAPSAVNATKYVRPGSRAPTVPPRPDPRPSPVGGRATGGLAVLDRRNGRRCRGPMRRSPAR